LQFDDVSIPTKVFNVIGNFQANFDDGWDPKYYSTIYDGKYYFHETSGLLIRVETVWHLVYEEDNTIWQHWNIEKNLLSINGETLNYQYEKRSIDPNSGYEWLIPVSIIGIVSIGVLIVILGKKSKKNVEK
jgi:hypothetical protein